MSLEDPSKFTMNTILNDSWYLVVFYITEGQFALFGIGAYLLLRLVALFSFLLIRPIRKHAERAHSFKRKEKIKEKSFCEIERNGKWNMSLKH